jgi:hypothetical protein
MNELYIFIRALRVVDNIMDSGNIQTSSPIRAQVSIEPVGNSMKLMSHLNILGAFL